MNIKFALPIKNHPNIDQWKVNTFNIQQHFNVRQRDNLPLAML